MYKIAISEYTPQINDFIHNFKSSVLLKRLYMYDFLAFSMNFCISLSFSESSLPLININALFVVFDLMNV